MRPLRLTAIAHRSTLKQNTQRTNKHTREQKTRTLATCVHASFQTQFIEMQTQNETRTGVRAHWWNSGEWMLLISQYVGLHTSRIVAKSAARVHAYMPLY